MNDCKRMRRALEQISLCSQNSMSSKEECGRIAREALAECKDERPPFVEAYAGFAFNGGRSVDRSRS